LLQLVRSARSRRLHFIGCAAYLLLSMLSEVVHVHPLVSRRPAAVEQGGQAVAAAAGSAHHVPRTSCAICQWQRAAPGADSPVAVLATPATSTVILPSVAAFPKSPIPHPAALRGPPSPAFS
jgi:hypothetical protein